MRAVVTLAGLALIGCTSEHELQFRSTVVTQSDGVAMSDDGLTSYAAMEGLTCALDVRWGCPTVEDDLPTDDERVLDHLEGTTLATSDAKLHFMNGGTWDPAQDLDVTDLRTARLSRAGLLMLHDDPSACRLDVGTGSVDLDASFCAASSFEVDRRGALLAMTDDGVFRADASGVTQLTDRGNRGAVDPMRDVVYVATAGDTRLQAVATTGDEAWSLEVDYPVRDLVARGDKGDVILLTEDANGLGRIERRDGETGEVRSIGTVPSAEGTLAVSANGRTLAIVTDHEIHHYEIVIEGEPSPVGQTVECQDLPVPQSPGVGFD